MIRLLIFCLLLGPLIQQGCGDVRVAPLTEANYASLKTQGKICTDLPTELGLTTKILFVVDKSGSNTDTDPGNILRADSIRNLINVYANNPRIFYGLIEFHDDGARFLIDIPSSEPGVPNSYFTNKSSVALDAVTLFEKLSDTGSTPYLAALSQAKIAVQNDLETRTDELSSNYNVIFISDGNPTDSTDTEIMNAVTSLTNLDRGNVHLSTIYYGPTNASAETRLQDMANLGSGLYQKAVKGQSLDLSRFVLSSESSEPYLMKKFVVYNLNASMCDDGLVGADSDADGLCDKDELRYNQILQSDSVRKSRMNGKIFNPQNRNSFNSHLSDAIYYRYIAYNEALPMGCTVDDDADNDQDLLSNCEEKFMFNQNPQGPTTSWTNKMIAFGKNSDPNYFDSDGDGILDSLEFFYFKNKSTPLNYNNLLDRTNGHDNEYLLLNHLNPLNPSSEVAYQGTFTKVDPDAEGRNCYTYSQPNLPLYKTQAVTTAQTSNNFHLSHGENENTLLIYFIESPEYAPNSKGFLRYSYQKMKKDVNTAEDLILDTQLFDIFPQ